ncbi:hypothetical protein E2C01_085864 [Portunus trituberculatus]|uniref:Uncharacterized protein n=1 Tax=Portunus trituberculatus TaxID=210409 RepID=A0A5B7IZ92_PORTR|nr:hypothetical protein [Portunus trituberculatus]
MATPSLASPLVNHLIFVTPFPYHPPSHSNICVPLLLSLSPVIPTHSPATHGSGLTGVGVSPQQYTCITVCGNWSEEAAFSPVVSLTAPPRPLSGLMSSF